LEREARSDRLTKEQVGVDPACGCPENPQAILHLPAEPSRTRARHPSAPTRSARRAHYAPEHLVDGPECPSSQEIRGCTAAAEPVARAQRMARFVAVRAAAAGSNPLEFALPLRIRRILRLQTPAYKGADFAASPTVASAFHRRPAPRTTPCQPVPLQSHRPGPNCPLERSGNGNGSPPPRYSRHDRAIRRRRRRHQNSS
jgi:hypothetical protein